MNNLTFSLNDKEMDNLAEWRSKHECLTKRIRHNEKFIFVGTGIGTAVSIKCTACKKKKDLTDSSNW